MTWLEACTRIAYMLGDKNGYRYDSTYTGAFLQTALAINLSNDSFTETDYRGLIKNTTLIWAAVIDITSTGSGTIVGTSGDTVAKILKLWRDPSVTYLDAAGRYYKHFNEVSIDDMDGMLDYTTRKPAFDSVHWYMNGNEIRCYASNAILTTNYVTVQWIKNPVVPTDTSTVMETLYSANFTLAAIQLAAEMIRKNVGEE